MDNEARLGQARRSTLAHEQLLVMAAMIGIATAVGLPAWPTLTARLAKPERPPQSSLSLIPSRLSGAHAKAALSISTPHTR
jgi:hypothetical protein